MAITRFGSNPSVAALVDKSVEVKAYNESSARYYYPNPYPTRDAALSQARYKYKAVVSEYGNQIKQKTFDEALREEKVWNGASGCVWVELTRLVPVKR